MHGPGDVGPTLHEEDERMGFIDCDTHVIEHDATWSYLSDEDLRYIPRVGVLTPPRTAGAQLGRAESPREIWMAGDTWCTGFKGDADVRHNGNRYLPEATQLTDPSQRIADLDALGIDVQVLGSTFWIGVEIEHPLAEIALCRSFNRWMAECLDGYTDRLPWWCQAPLRSMDAAVEELRFAKAHGAAGVQVRGIVHGMYLSDPYFMPFYECAEELGLAVVIHAGEAIRSIPNQTIGVLLGDLAAYERQMMPVMAGLHAVIASDLSTRFPSLRWAFVEGGATFALTVIQRHARLVSSSATYDGLHRMSADEFESKNVFLGVDPDEDVPYLIEALGAGSLVFGTDYGHNDIGSELGGHYLLTQRTDLDPADVAKIVDTNGRRLYLIDPDFTPAPPADFRHELPNVVRADQGGTDGPVLYWSRTDLLTAT
jgi:predicted TIM-barrel fold metal-dependent hydrolase